MIVNTAEIVRRQAAKGLGVGAFNVILLEQAEAFVAAAEQTQCPVVLQLSQNAISYHRGQLAPLGMALVELAKESTAEVAVHLDHAEDMELCKQAVDLGFSSVMYDGSKLSDEQNRANTLAISQYAHAQGVAVEAELGEIGGKNGVHDPSARTNPEDAAKFVADTHVDLLAVAVGSSHAMATRDAVLDYELIRQIRDRVPVPLVLHGSSGVNDEGMVLAIRAGMTKINVATHLNAVMTGKLRSVLEQNPSITDPRKYVGPAVAAMEEEVQRLLLMYSKPADPDESA